MARQRQIIPIHLGLNKSVEEVGLSVSGAALYDCVIDVNGDNIVVNRRPGLKAFADTGESAAIDGIFWWQAQEKMVVVCNGKGFTIDDSAGNMTTLTGSFFTAGKRAKFADFGTNIYGADQGKINKISTTAVTETADADAPTSVSHVVTLDQYLLANEMNSDNFHQSDVGAPDDWSAVYYSAEAQNDYIRAMGVEDLLIYALCDKSLEVFEDTGADPPMARLDGGYIPSGTVAPYSFIFCGAPVNSWVWIDHTKCLVALNGNRTTNLSDALNRYLQQDGLIVSDAAGDFINVMGHSFYALHLPTQQETPVYDFKSGLWQYWGAWNSGTGEYDRWRGNCAALAPAWGKMLVGDRANGQIYTLDTETYQDNSNTLRTLVRTGHIDRGDHWATKRVNRVDFRAKKTAPGGGSTITMMCRYRSNGETTWSNEKTITLSAASGETDYMGSLRNLGRYKTRQWEFYMTDNAPFAMLPPIEDYDITY